MPRAGAILGVALAGVLALPGVASAAVPETVTVRAGACGPPSTPTRGGSSSPGAPRAAVTQPASADAGAAGNLGFHTAAGWARATRATRAQQDGDATHRRSWRPTTRSAARSR